MPDRAHYTCFLIQQISPDKPQSVPTPPWCYPATDWDNYFHSVPLISYPPMICFVSLFMLSSVITAIVGGKCCWVSDALLTGIVVIVKVWILAVCFMLSSQSILVIYVVITIGPSSRCLTLPHTTAIASPTTSCSAPHSPSLYLCMPFSAPKPAPKSPLMNLS